MLRGNDWSSNFRCPGSAADPYMLLFFYIWLFQASDNPHITSAHFYIKRNMWQKPKARGCQYNPSIVLYNCIKVLVFWTRWFVPTQPQNMKAWLTVVAVFWAQSYCYTKMVKGFSHIVVEILWPGNILLCVVFYIPFQMKNILHHLNFTKDSLNYAALLWLYCISELVTLTYKQGDCLWGHVHILLL